jgi:hypothetical protein
MWGKFGFTAAVSQGSEANSASCPPPAKGVVPKRKALAPRLNNLPQDAEDIPNSTDQIEQMHLGPAQAAYQGFQFKPGDATGWMKTDVSFLPNQQLDDVDWSLF